MVDRLLTTSRDQRILSAARIRFETAGFRKTSIADIAEDAGVATGTIYFHFESKEGLFLRLIQIDNHAWLERAHGIVAGRGTALDRLGQLSTASVQHFRTSRLLLAVLRQDRQMIPAPMLESVHRELAAQSVSAMAELIRDGIAEGSIRKVDADQTAAVLFAAGHALFNATEHSYEELSAVLTDIAMRGLDARADPRPKAAS